MLNFSRVASGVSSVLAVSAIVAVSAYFASSEPAPVPEPKPAPAAVELAEPASLLDFLGADLVEPAAEPAPVAALADPEPAADPAGDRA